MRRLILVVLSFALVFTLFGSENINSKILKDSDTLTYLGDSITHGGRYGKYITAYYITRFPYMRINFISKGISGDTAEGILKRMDSDVLIPKPDVIMLMTGMNDSARDIFSTDNPRPPEKIAKVRKYVIDYYKYNINRMLKEFNSKGITRIIVFTPSIYDETSSGAKPKPLVGANKVLFEFGKIVKQTAPKYGAIVADIWSCTNSLNEEMQKEDKSASIISSDRVHPQNPGGFAIAAKYIKDAGEPSIVSETEIDFLSAKISKQTNCKISDLKKGKNSLSFASIEYALPFPILDDTKLVAKLIDFNTNINRQILRIKNLEKNCIYSVKIDGKTVGKYSSEELSNGINLAENTNTPQYEQAKKVLDLCEIWRDKYSKYRNFAYVELKHIKDSSITSDPQKAIEYVKTKFPEDKRFKGSAYYKGVHDFYCRNRMNKKKLEEEISSTISEAYTAAQPRPHIFEVTIEN